jgi:diguanylate cyclase (GGDEF)-like protein
VSVNHVSIAGSSGGPAGVGAMSAGLRGQFRLVRPTSWDLWKVPRPAVVYLLALDFLAVAVVVLSLVRTPMAEGELFAFIALMICGVLYIEASRSIERIRQYYAGTPHGDLNSVWLFAGVILLHPALSAVVIVTSYVYRWVRVRHRVVYRQTFSAAATILSGYLAHLFIGLTTGSSFANLDHNVITFGIVVAAAVIFLVLNYLFIVAAVVMSQPSQRPRALLSGSDGLALEAATVALGILLAWALVDWPVALVLIIGIMLVLHRNVLIRQLREKARTDPKTGLLNAAGWSTAVDAELTRAARADLTSGLLVIDLDHFKAFNDSYGHLAGDSILRTVADTISAEVRAYDIVGRFGGEEFVVLLPATSETETVHVAERIRARIASLPLPTPDDQLTVSIGVAVFPHHSKTLEELLHVADMAMYSAKASGRDRVHLAGTDCAAGSKVAKAAHNGSTRPIPPQPPIPRPVAHPNGTRPSTVESNIV